MKEIKTCEEIFLKLSGLYYSMLPVKAAIKISKTQNVFTGNFLLIRIRTETVLWLTQIRPATHRAFASNLSTPDTYLSSL